jgi:photosystem II stability/assembly factor-like uncharacterized protein
MYERHVAMEGSSLFGNLPWQFVGPTNVSGRMTDIAVLEPRGETYTIFVAGASGGVWRTENEGVTWEPVLEDAVSTSMGDVTVAPSDQDIVWVGTGEANIFRSSMAGAGVYKSTDGGDTWRHMGLTDTNTIPRIVIHPTDPDIVWVAASGHEWTPNEMRGVFKTTDGGESWEKVLYVDDETGAIDLVMDPRTPDRLYASTWQRTRLKWNDPRNEEGYDGSGVWRSEDGGESWTPLNEGLPAPEHRGRIGIDVARSNPDVLYAFVDNYEIARMPEEGETDAYGRPRAPVIKGATLFRSDDRGESWRQVSEETEYMRNLGGTYGWVFGQMRVDPNDENTVYVMGLALNKSTDGGRTYERLCCMHGDHHGLWIDPANSDYLVNVNDGGVDISYDGGENWRAFNDVGLTLVQFFDVALDRGDPIRVYGSVQDHGSFRGVVDLSNGRHRIPAVEFESAPGGEGSDHQIDPTDPDIVYSAGFYGRIQRTDMATGETELVVPQAGEGEPPLRGQWLAPFILSPHDPNVVYHGMNRLFRSMDRGETWEAISPDLTYNELDRIGDIPYQTLFSIAESPFRFGLVYAGTDDGRVWRTENGGEAWAEITGDLVPGKFIAEIVASGHDEGTVYLVQNGKREDDFMPYVWKSTDHGDTWTDLAGGVPSGPVNVIAEDPENPRVLYLGTDLGAYVSIDGGESWQSLSHGLPTTFVQDMEVHPDEDILVAGTHGRGVFAMDVRPIQELTPDVVSSGLHVFDVESVELVGQRFFGGGFVSGPTAHIAYWLGDAASVDVVVKDDSGAVIAELEGTGDPGYNAALWDLRRTAEEGERARLARPGSYTVEVSAGGRTATGTLVVTRPGGDG